MFGSEQTNYTAKHQMNSHPDGRLNEHDVGFHPTFPPPLYEQQHSQHQHVEHPYTQQQRPPPYMDMDRDGVAPSMDVPHHENEKLTVPPENEVRKEEEELNDSQEDEALEEELLEEEKQEEAEQHDMSEEQKSHRLECRDSVMEFVINASDQKDECDGLRRAFDAACTNLDMAESIFNPQQQVIVHAPGYDPNIDRVNPNLLPKDSSNHPFVHRTRSEDIWGAARGSTRRGGGDGAGDMDLKWAQDNYGKSRDHSADNKEGIGSKVSQAVRNDQSRWWLINWMADKFQGAISREDESLPDTEDYYIVADSIDENASEEWQVLDEDATDDQMDDRRGRRKIQISPAIPSNTQNPGNFFEPDMQQGPMDMSFNHQAKGHQQQFARPFIPKSHPSQLYSHAQSILDSPESIEARTCCASILNVFHEHCDRNEEVEYTDRSLFVIVSVIALCGIVKSLIRYFEIRWLPEAGGCILVGVALGFFIESMPKVHFSFDGSLFLRVMLPFIVFHAALSIDKHALYDLVIPIILYACVGTFLSSAIIAVIIYVGTGFGMPGRESFIFGALISSIDPIAILSVLTSIGMSNTDAIYVMIFGESLFNDGVAIVLYETLIRFLDESVEINSMEIWEATVHFVVVMLGSTLVGVLSGGCCTVYFYSMRGCQTPLVEVLIFICWALIPYYICDGLTWSGIVGIIAASIMMDLFVIGNKPESHVSLDVAPSTPIRAQYHESDNLNNGTGVTGDDELNSTREERVRIFTRRGHLSSVARTHIGFVSEINATLMETSIFAYLGLFLLSSRYKWNFYLTVLAILSCLVSRAIMIPTLSFVLNRFCSRNVQRRNAVPYANGENGTSPPTTQRKSHNKIVDARMQIVMWFGGLRGAMSFALVENIPLFDASSGFGSRLKPELKAMTSASIIFSVFVCGGSTYYLLERLGMTPGGNNADEDDSLLELQPLSLQPLSKRKVDPLPSSIKASPEPSERKDVITPSRFHSYNSAREPSLNGVRHR